MPSTSILRRSIVLPAVVTAAAAFCLGLAGTYTHTHFWRHTLAFERLDAGGLPVSQVEDESHGLRFTLASDYSNKQSFAASPLYPWEYVAEPHRVTTFTAEIKGTNRDDSSGVNLFLWTIDGEQVGGGPSVDWIFTTVGDHTVSVNEHCLSCPGGAALASRTFTETVKVKYVRREIRSLTDDDREDFFNAVEVLQRLETEEGQETYGPLYKGKDYFNRMHLHYGGQMDCDHWHQGPGFVTSHVMITLEFEKALQAVNPKVAVPYWDFTLESTFFNSETWRQSKVFLPDWFGAAAPQNDLHTVTEGRWAYVPVMQNSWNYSVVQNSYGLLRAPWNNDNTPYLTRSDHVFGFKNNLKPRGCSSYAKCLGMDNWGQLSGCLNSDAHGHIHELIGGSWGQEKTNSGRVKDTMSAMTHVGSDMFDSVLSLVHDTQALSKDLWRAGYLTCPDFCDISTPTEDCSCGCDDSILEDQTAYEILRDSGILNNAWKQDSDHSVITKHVGEDGVTNYRLVNKEEEQAEKTYKGMLDLMCTPGQIGDMFQATSPNDITFWVLHPSLDRLWHYMRLTDSYDDTWDEDPAVCEGHNPSDTMPFKGSLLQSHTGEAGEEFLSNKEIYARLDPTNDNMPYTYDNFFWSHCEMVGFDMTPSNAAVKPVRGNR